MPNSSEISGSISFPDFKLVKYLYLTRRALLHSESLCRGFHVDNWEPWILDVAAVFVDFSDWIGAIVYEDTANSKTWRKTFWTLFSLILKDIKKMWHFFLLFLLFSMIFFKKLWENSTFFTFSTALLNPLRNGAKVTLFSTISTCFHYFLYVFDYFILFHLLFSLF